MKYVNSKMYDAMMPSDIVEEIAKSQARELINSILGRIEKNKWYAIRMTEGDFNQVDAYTVKKTITVEIEPARERTIVHIPPEEIYLSKSNISLKKKLKNCIDYLRDKSGGRLQEQEVNNECID